MHSLHPHLHLIADHRALLSFAGATRYYRDQIAALRQPGGDKALATACQEALDGLDDLLSRTLERAESEIEARIEAAESVDGRMKRLGELRAASQENATAREALESRYGVQDRNYWSERRGLEDAMARISAEWRQIEQSLQADMAEAAALRAAE